MPQSSRSKRESLPVETLEQKRLLVAFGIPWSQPQDLTVSFPSDGVQVGQASNQLHEKLNSITDQDKWQELVLRAYQTWSLHADINVGLRNDHDLAFGTPGLSESDPRFGDFRVGAMPQHSGLANAFPFQSIAGTYSGDLLLNANEDFSFHDWQDGIGPSESDSHDLFSVLLHETGNTLGLADSPDDTSVVMFGQYTSPKGLLQAGDIEQIQLLYGERQDLYESADNGNLLTASILQTPVGMDPAVDVARYRASIAHPNDVDYFEIDLLTGQTQLQLTANVEGVSLLKSRVDILDEQGNLLHSVASESVFNNNVSINVDGLDGHEKLFVRVAAADPNDVYSVGDYELHVDYRDAATRLNDVHAGDFQSGADSLFTNFDLLDSEVAVPQTASAASDFANVNTAGQYSSESSVGGAGDIDLWRVPSSVNGGDSLQISVFGIGADRPDLRIQLVNAQGNSVGVAGRITADGTWVLNATNLADQEHFVRVSVDPNSATEVGNYVVVAESQEPSDQMNDLVEGDLSSGNDDYVRWNAFKSKLFRFDLESQADASEAVRLTVYDAHTREVRAVVSARGEQTRTAMIWLEQGDYIFRFSAIGMGDDQAGLDLSYRLRAEGLSDDQYGDDDDDGSVDDGEYDYTYVDPQYDYVEPEVDMYYYGMYDDYYYYYYYEE